MLLAVFSRVRVVDATISGRGGYWNHDVKTPTATILKITETRPSSTLVEAPDACPA